ncbi:protein of unknown function [Bacillus sp. OV166]|uniref:DUF202 domain-containing protein n=1 Tax=Bacillus sp. OV166 TaxID=1882763 RepID=UPI000A2ACA58|nr:DUF202 domain-containing protein [Bacillus sp. OV166]SMQ80598.1 protein of unknown function [Bacillus sp. OV166]
MRKIKSFFKQDSNLLRDVIGGLICLSIGIFKVFYQTDHRIYSLAMGSILIVVSILVIVWAILDYKRKRKRS